MADIKEERDAPDATARWVNRWAPVIAANVARAQAEAAAVRIARRPAEPDALELALRAVRAAEGEAVRIARIVGNACFYLGYVTRDTRGLNAIGRRNMRSTAFRGINIARRNLRAAERTLATATVALDALRIADELTASPSLKFAAE